ncbi:AAA+-type ATPase [Heterobasidion irregulare TC 32-1]|uniref:AAA+-type ATPase n=1 Tax=Heterobasidion irregulare (strain TC 32-1) TaxID=747525 RepID=W4KGB0_HETIT|nr:AAA+-type ATPase [Heterobasidion irregulare TC 32-1]ETW84330.1 AAA+-type ATPase [Heterobasidion irregulare TC 32-1]
MAEKPSASVSNSLTWPVHVEVRLSPTAFTRFETVRNSVHEYITSSFEAIALPSTLDGWQDMPVLSSCVERIVACESPCPTSSIPVERAALQIHVYQPTEADASEEFSSSGGGEGEEVMAASVCELPSRMWDGLWESLIFEDDTKLNLLDYIYATVLFSDANVDFNIVSWNRVVLLHGPPGTGKTSLCRALAQKLSIRLSQRYSHARLLEINSHSLFSRWFSESGKLVQRLFSSVMDLVDDEDTFVVVLIDEVESLTAARAGAMAGTEPSDALRVVNALLTQLDKLRHKKNVLVVSTSNLPKAIDSAFVDRADIVQYVDLPAREAIYAILRTCLLELIVKGIVTPVDIPEVKEAKLYARTVPTSQWTSGGATIPAAPSEQTPRERAKHVALCLFSLAQKCRDQGMSGRSLRRLPVLAQARYIGLGFVPAPTSVLSTIKPSTNGTASKNGPVTGNHNLGTSVEVWLNAMERVIDSSSVERKRLEN